MRAVNLIPADQRSGSTGVAGRSGGGAFIVLGVLAGLAILVFLYGSARRQISSKEAEAASITAQAQSAETQVTKLSPYTSFTSLHDERVKEIAQLVGTRFDWAHVFHEVGRVLPTDVSLSSIQGSIGSSGGSSTTATAASTNSATPAGSVPTMTITGCTVSQSAVAVALGRLRLIDGVSEVQLESSTKSAGGSSSSASTVGGTCGENDPTFTAQITFTALPTPSTSSSTTGDSSTAVASASAPQASAAVGQPSTTTPTATTTQPTSTATTQPGTSTSTASPQTSTSTAASGAD